MGSDNNYVIALVVDANFGDRLGEVARRFDVWVVPSSENRKAVEKLREEKAEGKLGLQISMWSNPIDVSLESAWLGMLNDIELHHGEYSHHPPVSELEVVGTEANHAARVALLAYGYSQITPTKSGFRARKVAAV
jgi:hypothetical protein